MSNYIAREKWIRLAFVWQEAFKARTTYEIPCPDFKSAQNLRGELYASMRRARKARTKDEALIKCGDELAITIKGTNVVLYRRAVSPFTKSIIDMVDNNLIDSSLSRLGKLAKKVEQEMPLTPSCLPEDEECEMPRNPYFTRED